MKRQRYGSRGHQGAIREEDGGTEPVGRRSREPRPTPAGTGMNNALHGHGRHTYDLDDAGCINGVRRRFVAKPPSKRKKMWAVGFQCACNRWIFARLQSDRSRRTAYELNCPSCGRIYSVRESELSFRRITTSGQNLHRPQKPATRN